MFFRDIQPSSEPVRGTAQRFGLDADFLLGLGLAFAGRRAFQRARTTANPFTPRAKFQPG